MDRPFIPEAVLQAVTDYVTHCSWCGTSNEASPKHHRMCPVTALNDRLRRAWEREWVRLNAC
jgi:hypothetical protein